MAHLNQDSLHSIDRVRAVALSYRDEWNDGFGARGWKLDSALGYPDMIAATSYPGLKSPTSVPVHDVLDHWLPGFGYDPWDEAKATLQHALRNALDIDVSYTQLARDILGGTAQPDSGTVAKTMEQLYLAGAAAMPDVLAAWHRRGLDFTRRHAIGLCLQSLLEQAERLLAEHSSTWAHARFLLGNDSCRMDIAPENGFAHIRLYAHVVSDKRI
ncbi:hypothetical protein ACJU26_05530 [Acidithiobacillus sp. M4-SHS-6]|uniref:hypothetical protein n=1 Tax=Acidithiobacillus sp. M4-SHS-6 TaxID=3383024 RepID=UPI0039BDE32B